MAMFTDGQNREWKLALDALVIMRIRDECDEEFLKKESQATFQRMQDDPALLCRVLYHLCAKERATYGVNEEQFYLDVLGNGDTIQKATDALLKAIVSFIPPHQRALLEAAAAKNQKIRELATTKAIQAINDPATQDKILEHVDQEISKVLTQYTSASNSPASAASIPEA